MPSSPLITTPILDLGSALKNVHYQLELLRRDLAVQKEPLLYQPAIQAIIISVFNPAFVIGDFLIIPGRVPCHTKRSSRFEGRRNRMLNDTRPSLLKGASEMN